MLLILRNHTHLLLSTLFGLSLAQLGIAFFLRKFQLKPTESNRKDPVKTYATAVLVSCAFAESIGVCGLVLFLLRPDFQTLYMFIAVSAIAMIVYRPKREELEGLL